MLNFIKRNLLPISMTLGIVFHTFFAHFAHLTPFLIFFMLLITYSQLSLKDIRLEWLHVYLLSIQILLSVALFFLIKPYNIIIAQALMICILAPTASSSVVVTKLLGGNIASLTSYNLLSNLTVALLAPLILSFASQDGYVADFDLITTFVSISMQIIPLLILPFVFALAIQAIGGPLLKLTIQLQSYSLFIWAIALTIVSGKIVEFILQQTSDEYRILLFIALLSLLVCIAQFLIGRRLGSRTNNTIAGGQALGQKNTILAIWMTQHYLNPLAAIGPGAYVLWQNMVNSYQLWRKENQH